MTKRFGIVNAFLLMKAINNKTGFKAFYGAIGFAFDSVNPFIGKNIKMWLKQHKSPSASALESCELLSHGLTPLWTFVSLCKTGRFNQSISGSN